MSAPAGRDDIREYADTTERLLSAAGIWRFDPQSALAFPELLDELLDREALRCSAR